MTIRTDLANRLFWVRSMIAYRRPWKTVWRFATAPAATIPTFDEILPKALAAEEATAEQGHAILELSARRLLGISADEFLRQWDAGILDYDSGPNVSSVAMLIPFARSGYSGTRSAAS